MRKFVRMTKRGECPIPTLVGALVSQVQNYQSELNWTTLSSLCVYCRRHHRQKSADPNELPSSNAFGSCIINQALRRCVVPHIWKRYLIGPSRGQLYFTSRRFLRLDLDDPRRLAYEQMLWAKANVIAHLFGHACSFPEDVIWVLGRKDKYSSLQAASVRQSLRCHGCPCRTFDVNVAQWAASDALKALYL